MSKIVSDFLDKVCGEIKYKGVHGGISQEIESHINERIDYYIEAGLSEAEASNKAVEQMGDPTEIGQNLNKTHKPKTEWSIIALIGVMVIMGIVSVFTLVKDPGSYLSFEGMLTSYILYVLIGMIVFLTTLFFDYKRMEKYSLHIVLGALFFVLVGQLLFQRNRLGYSRVAFQMISIAVPFLIIAFSGLIKRWCNGNVKDMFKLLGLAGSTTLFLLIFTVSLSTTIGLLFTILISLTVSIWSKDFKGDRVRWLMFLYGSGITGVLFITLFLKPYQMARLVAFTNPEKYSTGAGWTIMYIRELLSHAKLWGQSGSLYYNFEGVDRIYLPSANTDFIFVYMVSAFGWAMGIAVILVIITFIYRMYLAFRKTKEGYGKTLAISIISIFSLQAIANILMNLGIFPTLSVSLPFMSQGGINFVVNMALMGLLLGIYRRKELVVKAVSGGATK